MSFDFKPIVTVSLPRQIAERIRQLILSGELAVDDRLPTEHELADRFGVSRPTIREALKRLAAQNLVRSKRGPQGGTFVTRPSIDDAQDNLINLMTLLVGIGDFDFDQVLDARLKLECLCTKMSAGQLPENLDQAMAAELDLQNDLTLSDEEFCASDVRFHRALVDSAGNAFLGFLLSAVIEALQPVANLITLRHRERSRIVDQHWRLLGALRAGDNDGAVEILEQQARDMKGRYQTVLAERASRA